MIIKHHKILKELFFIINSILANLTFQNASPPARAIYNQIRSYTKREREYFNSFIFKMNSLVLFRFVITKLKSGTESYTESGNPIVLPLPIHQRIVA